MMKTYWKISMLGFLGAVVVALGPTDPAAAGRSFDSDPGPLAGPQVDRDPPPPGVEEWDEGEPGDGDSPRRFDRDRHERRRGPRGDRDRRGPGEGRRRGFHGPRQEVTKEMVDEAMQVLESVLPEWHQRLANVRQNNPERFRGAFRRIFPMIREYMSLREHDPEIAETVIEEFKTEHQLRETARRYREVEAGTAEQEELDASIEELVRKQFDLRMKRRKARLDEVEERLQRQREQFEEDQANQETMIAEQVERIKQGEPRKFRGRGKHRERRFDGDDRHPRRRHRGDDRRPPRDRRLPPNIDDEGL